LSVAVVRPVSVASVDGKLVPPSEVASAPQPAPSSHPSSDPGAVPLAQQAAEPLPPTQSVSEPPPKRSYPDPARIPTQEGPKGVRFDFNQGCRILLTDSEHPWQVRISDLDTANILFQTELKSGWVASSKRYFRRFRLEVGQQGKFVFDHDYSAAGQEVLIQIPTGTLGDPLGWFPYAVKFKERHGCRLTCSMSEKLIPLFRESHPDIAFVTHEDVKPERYYATYNIGLFFDDTDEKFQPCDFRHVGLHRTAGYILGVDPTEKAPLIAVSEGGRPIAEPYVCIAVQSTTQAKYWNNPNGWREVVAFLKEAGYRVVCIDQKPVHGGGLVWNHIPHGVEDQTGDRPLAERARWLKYAEFFVGLSSGLAWLAWGVGIPVVMISGFTHPTNEFATPYRVINYNTCNSCWNDVRHRFDHKDFLWCPRHANTPRQFECTRHITATQVKAVIRTIPGFGTALPQPA
jgi:autotransporter strand-loop-strand O-heptosyltransferase